MPANFSRLPQPQPRIGRHRFPGAFVVLVGIGGAIASQPAQSASLTSLSPDQPLVEQRYKQEAAAEYIRTNTDCPARLEPLSALLLRDLPSYANRVSTRAQVAERTFNPKSYVITASVPEFAEVAPGFDENVPSPAVIEANGVEQVFFTTLSRQYRDDTVDLLQHHHWVFLAPDAEGWRLSLMFSRIATYPENEPPAPLYESSEGVIGRGIQLWLRDCRAGAIAPLETE
ncbi:MAG: hypothetical protein VKK04_01980 [Synechococcales bacterium]|nr:hypothetical protein [Synechococcales bacterium]